MSAQQHTLTIEYLDAQGQVQRTEQLHGEQFTLRVQSEALSVQASLPSASSAEPESALQAASLKPWQRVSPWLLALMLFGIYALLTAIDLWVEYSPDDSAKNLVTFSLGIIGVIALWAAFWALLGKIFAKHARFWEHVCLVLAAGIVLTVIVAAMHFFSFSLSWRMLGKIDVLTMLAGLCLLAWAHLRLIVPVQRRLHLRWGMLALTLAAVALLMWSNHRRQGTMLDRLHAPHLYRPALQMASPTSSADFFKQAKALEATLKARAQETEPGEDNTNGDED
jgi:hypothetical protein